MITIDEVKSQLREVLLRSLPQAADALAEFNEESPLQSSSFELDSIDSLLLVLEIEKKFGIRIVADEFDEKIWRNLNSLAQAIQERILASQTSAKEV